MLLAKYRNGSNIFAIETVSGSPDYRCSIGRADAPHSFMVESERAEEMQNYLLTLENEGWIWERVK